MSPGGEATAAAIADLQAIDLLDRGSQLVLQAVSQTGEPASRAFKAWRALSTLDDADYKHHRAMPLLAELAVREKIDDPDMARMRGVGRHLWTSNTLKLNLLFKALDALNSRRIIPLVLSGVALYARVPDMIRQRALGELEILIHPQQLKLAGEALAAHGFVSLVPAVVVFDQILLGGEKAGIRLKLADHVGEIILGCQPLPAFSCALLTDALWQRSVQQALGGRNVRVPTAIHQLFCAMARCEPWDQVECFTRLLEATALLSAANAELDWHALAQLTRQLGLEEAARSFFAVLARDTAHAIPDAFFAETAKTRTVEGIQEWRIRARRPTARKQHERRLLLAQDRRYDREGHWIAPPSRFETVLRLFWPQTLSMRALRKLASRRILPHTPQSPLHVGDVSSPTSIIARTQGHWAILTLPLTEAQKAGQPVSLQVTPFLPITIALIAASGGRKTVRGKGTLDVVVLPTKKLGGDGVVLMRLTACRTPPGFLQNAQRSSI